MHTKNKKCLEWVLSNWTCGEIEPDKILMDQISSLNIKIPLTIQYYFHGNNNESTISSFNLEEPFVISILNDELCSIIRAKNEEYLLLNKNNKNIKYYLNEIFNNIDNAKEEHELIQKIFTTKDNKLILKSNVFSKNYLLVKFKNKRW